MLEEDGLSIVRFVRVLVALLYVQFQINGNAPTDFCFLSISAVHHQEVHKGVQVLKEWIKITKLTL